MMLMDEQRITAALKMQRSVLAKLATSSKRQFNLKKTALNYLTYEIILFDKYSTHISTAQAQHTTFVAAFQKYILSTVDKIARQQQ